MKLNLLPLLTGAIAFTLITAPTIVQAQLGETQTQCKLAEVELSETQRTQLKEIRRNTRFQIEAVLTLEQKRQLESSQNGHKQQRTAFATMNFSPQQQTQIESIMRAKTRNNAIFTAEQKQQIKRNMEQRRQQQQN